MMQFSTCALIVSPLGYLWLESLESWFPGTEPATKQTEDEKEKSTPTKDKSAPRPRLNITNTIAKVVIDQVIGGAWNTALFLITMGLLRGLDTSTIQSQIYSVSDVIIFHPGARYIKPQPMRQECASLKDREYCSMGIL